jgi:hypothetical protein
MDIATLKALGVSPEELQERIVEQCVECLLEANGFNPETEEDEVYETKFKREIKTRIQQAVDAKIAAVAAEHLLPRIGEMIEKADMRKTNRYGEPQTPSMSFKEYIAHRAESYMTEDVNYHGESKADLEAKNSSAYDWRSSGPRLTVLMRNYIQTTLDEHAKAAVNDVNKVIAKNIENAAKAAITAAAAAIKVTAAA